MNLFSLPSASPKQTLVQDFGLGKITISYSRPSLRGRTVFGENSLLAPLGKLWRNGADGPTLVTFSDNITIGDTFIEASTYSIFVIPSATTWEIIINKGLKGIGAYSEQDDVLRITAPIKEKNESTETFTINIQQLSFENCTLQFSWANVLVDITVKTQIVERLHQSYEVQLASENKPHFSAAYFYFLLGNNHSKALEQVNIALEGNAGAYYMHYLKALIEFTMGDLEAAKHSANNTLAAANAAGSADYTRLANDLLTKL